MIALKHPRQRIFVAFLTYALISFGVATLCFWLFRRVESINALSDNVHEIHIDIGDLSKLSTNFLLYESFNAEFYRTGSSVYLNDYVLKQQKVLLKIDLLGRSPQAQKWSLEQDLDTLKNEIEVSISLMKELSRLMRARGYQGYGKEGTLYKLTQQMEALLQPNHVAILQLRRYERDFISCSDSSVLEGWHAYFVQVRKDLLNRFRYTPQKKNVIDSLLNSYQSTFQQLIDLEHYIGYRTKTSLTLDIEVQHARQLARINKLDKYTQEKKEQILNQLRFITVVVITVSVIVSMLLSLSFPYIMKI